MLSIYYITYNYIVCIFFKTYINEQPSSQL